MAIAARAMAKRRKGSPAVTVRLAEPYWSELVLKAREADAESLAGYVRSVLLEHLLGVEGDGVIPPNAEQATLDEVATELVALRRDLHVILRSILGTLITNDEQRAQVRRFLDEAFGA